VQTGRSVTIARHGNKVIPVGRLHAMIRQAGLTVEEYLAIEP
jgi:predicted RNA binding protein YcfA (HicA-like mRNA interferase family)